MSPNTLDIGSKNAYPARVLSNFAAHAFELDFIEISSMEGFLQSLKFDKVHIQNEICNLSGIAAKKRGADRNNQWKVRQGLWWQGEFYPRQSDDYQRLLDRAFIALARASESFRQAIHDTGDLILTHHMGRSSEHETILTQSEFCKRLMTIRNLLRKGINLNTVKKL